MRVHWFYAAHDAATSLIYTKQKAGGKKAAAALSRLGAVVAALLRSCWLPCLLHVLPFWLSSPSNTKPCCCCCCPCPWPAAVDGFDERQVFRARDNRLYQHEYLIDMLEW